MIALEIGSKVLSSICTVVLDYPQRLPPFGGIGLFLSSVECNNMEIVELIKETPHNHGSNLALVHAIQKVVSSKMFYLYSKTNQAAN